MRDFVKGTTPLFQRLLKDVESYAAHPWPVLILGETGVGKEVIARELHERSGRNGAFVPVNCGAIPGGLFESEFFGYEKGAFSGANQSARGLIRQAHGGTLFLDEVGELPPTLQTKLLRFLDSGEVRALGSLKIESCNVRLIAATNRDLYTDTGKGAFRHDLLERLSALVLEVPPLRLRQEDIPLLSKAFLARMGVNSDGIDFTVLSRYGWPGNIRQLNHILLRAVLRSRGEPDASTLERVLVEESRRFQGGTGGHPISLLQGSLAEIEKQVIVDRLKRFRGNRKRAAKELGIAKSTLQEKLRRWAAANDGRCVVPPPHGWDDADGTCLDRAADVDL